jgi:hypothetical protein
MPHRSDASVLAAECFKHERRISNEDRVLSDHQGGSKTKLGYNRGRKIERSRGQPENRIYGTH